MQMTDPKQTYYQRNKDRILSRAKSKYIPVARRKRTIEQVNPPLTTDEISVLKAAKREVYRMYLERTGIADRALLR